MQVLTVIYSFAEYKVGDQITDTKVIAQIREGHNASKVVSSNMPDQKPA